MNACVCVNWVFNNKLYAASLPLSVCPCMLLYNCEKFTLYLSPLSLPAAVEAL